MTEIPTALSLGSVEAKEVKTESHKLQNLITPCTYQIHVLSLVRVVVPPQVAPVRGGVVASWAVATQVATTRVSIHVTYQHRATGKDPSAALVRTPKQDTRGHITKEVE